MVRLALLACAVLLAAEPAAAGSRQKLMAVRLELGDLDLRTEAGTTAAMRRLDATARDLCARTASPLFPGWEGRAWKCRRDAVAAAVARSKT